MIGYNKSRLVYYCPIKRAHTPFGPREPQELFPFHFTLITIITYLLSITLACLGCLGLACLTLVSPPTAHGLLTYQHT
jgi:hypothetical protein